MGSSAPYIRGNGATTTHVATDTYTNQRWEPGYDRRHHHQRDHHRID